MAVAILARAPSSHSAQMAANRSPRSQEIQRLLEGEPAGLQPLDHLAQLVACLLIREGLIHTPNLCHSRYGGGWLATQASRGASTAWKPVVVTAGKPYDGRVARCGGLR